MKGKHWFYLVCLGLIILSCEEKNQSPYEWFYILPDTGTNSSPHVTDLNSDGIKDIIIGTGKNEQIAHNHAVIALDGHTGKELWKVGGNDQILGSALFQDINGDEIDDVFIGGRNAMLYAINGATGQVIWEYDNQGSLTIKSQERYNFYNPQLIPDQTQDGISDLLISYGGNPYAAPEDTIHREGGLIIAMDAVKGEIIALDTVPDGRETYMPPIYYAESGSQYIVYGSGGQSIGGALYRATLDQLMQHKLEESEVLIQKTGRGFIAPPVAVDITSDGIKDIVANWHGGEVIAINGATKEIIWQQSYPDTEANASPVPGYFNSDETLDFVSTFQQGTWPNNFASIVWMIDGKTGEEQYMDTLGCAGYPSPVSIDIDNNGDDEVILSYNDYYCYGYLKEDMKMVLAAIDFNPNKITKLVVEKGKNVSTTPWVGDLDGDEKIDIIFSVQANSTKMIYFSGMGIGRKELSQTIQKAPTWGAFMGNEYNGVK